jgi:endonuclease/exonuclease/phosphatase family metal-dependent hydrolase
MNYNSFPLPKMVSSLLTVMTWNMWFDKKNRIQRTETLLNEVRCYDPDILALQEVIPETLEIIIAKMRPTYYIIGTISPDVGYDTLILSKFPPIEWNRYYLPKTKMGRNLLLTTLQTPTRQITVGTFHLESVFFPRTKTAEELKESQLKYIYAISPINSILMGDTNLVIDKDQYPLPSPESPKAPNNPPIIDVFYVPLPLSKRSIPLPLSQRGIPPNDEQISSEITNPDIHDLAEQEIASQPNTSSLAASDASPIHQETSGLGEPDASGLGVCPFLKGAGAVATYCGRTNKHIKNKSIQSRLDRIYVKIKRNSLKVHFYGLTGTFTQPSDHFGVFAQLEF